MSLRAAQPFNNGVLTEAVTFLRQQDERLNLVAEVQAEWGAQREGHRSQIHEAAAPYREFSISHCWLAGGFVAVANGSHHFPKVGFDIEEVRRVTRPVVKRISNESDDPDHRLPFELIWSAKEAAFKALKGPLQPLIIPTVALKSWKMITELDWSFRFSVTANPLTLGFGIASLRSDLQVAIAVRADTYHSIGASDDWRKR